VIVNKPDDWTPLLPLAIGAVVGMIYRIIRHGNKKHDDDSYF
jgi:hypothetical protein